MTHHLPWGDHEPGDEIIVAGLWRVVHRGSELADIAYDGVSVLRAVRFVTRDRDWRTAEDVVLDTGPGSIEAASSYDGREVLRYRLSYSFDDAVLRVHATATLSIAFERNRIGLVVLHSPELAGSPLTVRHATDGSTEETTYPTWISPHQPAVDVAGYEWDGITLDLEGDVFEMEDQRNWTDASYKTYSTLLSEPFPVALEAGTTITQSLTLRVDAAHRSGGPVQVHEVPHLEPSSRPGPSAPVLQVLASSAPSAERPADELVRTGRPVLVEPDLTQPNWPAVLESARRDAQGAPLDVRFVAEDDRSLRAAIDRARGSGPIVRVGAFDPVRHITTAELQRSLRAAQRADADLALVAGARSHFTELNRTIDEFAGWDGPLAFSITPQMHDRSRAQVEESIRMQRWVVLSASRLAGGRPLHVGPVTLRPRLNAVATSQRPGEPASIDGGYGPQFVPDATAPAQGSDAAAAWLMASVAALSVPGVESITVFEAWGPRGLAGTPAGRALFWLP